MKKNVIILTAGLAGSSVLTALLSKAGYWVGDATIKKVDYDTWENAEVVELNSKIFQETGFQEDWTMVYRPEFISRITQQADNLDPKPFLDFIEKCSRHQPWVWKDPRFWLTIRHWRRFLDLSNLCFLVIRRDGMQYWISTTIRRQVQTFGHSRRYSESVHGSLLDFLRQEQASYVDILYEDLLITPEKVIDDINRCAGSTLTLADFKKIFRGRIGRKQHGLKNFLHAAAVYLKNYPDRYR